MNYNEIKKEYKVVRKKILEIKGKGQLKRNIYLSESEKVINAEKFIDNHIKALDHFMNKKDNIRFNKNTVLPYLNRLNMYLTCIIEISIL